MSRLILPAKNGQVIFSGEHWCRVSVIFDGIETAYGCEVREYLYQKITDRLSEDMNDSLTEIISGEKFQYLCGLSAPHTAIYISYKNGYAAKLLFVPKDVIYLVQKNENGLKYLEYDEEKSEDTPIIIELSEKDQIEWREKLSQALSADK